MTLESRIREHYGAIVPASFAGIHFSAGSGDVAGGWDSASEQQFGRGTRPRPIAQAQKSYPIRGYVTGPGALTTAQALERAFDAGAAELVHPWVGRIQALAARWQIRFSAESLEWADIDVEFQATELPEVEDAGDVPTTADEALATLASQGAAFATEERAIAQLDNLRTALILEPSDLTGEDYARQVTTELLTSGSAPAADVPMAVQRLGAGVRTTEAGNLTSADAAALEDAVLTIADRNDSLTLLRMLETFQLYLGPVGGAALASVEKASGENLQAVAVRAEQSLDILAQRNRAAVLAWFAREELRT